MNRGEELIRKFEEALLHMAKTLDKKDVTPAIEAKMRLREYIAGLEIPTEPLSYEDDPMSCGDFTPEDFNMIEERNTIIDDINNEGFEIFEVD